MNIFYAIIIIVNLITNTLQGAQQPCWAIVPYNAHNNAHDTSDSKNPPTLFTLTITPSSEALTSFYNSNTLQSLITQYKSQYTARCLTFSSDSKLENYDDALLNPSRLFSITLGHFFKKNSEKNLLHSTWPFLKMFNCKGSFSVASEYKLDNNPITATVTVTPTPSFFNENRLKIEHYTNNTREVYYFPGEKTDRDRDNKKFCIKAGLLGFNVLGIYAFYKIGSWGFSI